MTADMFRLSYSNPVLSSSMVLVELEWLNLASFLFSFDHYIVYSWIYEARVAQ
jgi:hypothetical protein